MHKEERLSCSVCRQDYWSLDALQRHRKEYNHFLSKSYYHDSPSSPIAEDKPEPLYENISSEEDGMNDDIVQSSEKDYFQAPGLQSLLMIDSHNHLQQICDVRRGISKDTLRDLLSESWKLGFEEFELWKAIVVLHNPNDWKSLDYLDFDDSIVKLSVGVHPHLSKQVDEDVLEKLDFAAKHPACIAIGESGLDLTKDFSTLAQQKFSLRKHVILANEICLPLILHIRGIDAIKEFMRMNMDIKVAIVIHSCALPWKIIEDMVSNYNVYVSVNTLLNSTCSEGMLMREVATYAPLNSILVETDAPKLPMSTPGGTNIEGNIGGLSCVMKKLWELRKKDVGSVHALSAVIFQNTLRAFPGLK